jgi:RND family efflux transporter MFP subunit
MQLKRRVLWTSLAVIAIVGITVFEFSGRKAHASLENAPSLPIAAVQPATRGTMQSSITLSGEFRPYQEVDLHAKVAGYIKAIYVDVGDKVKEGQTLAILEVPELNAQVLAAQAAMRRSKEGINRAEKDLNRAQSAYTAAHAAYTRLKQASLARPGLIAEQELDDSLAKDQEAEAQVGSASAALAEARSQLSVSEADQQHYEALEAYSHITAPFTGVVTKRYADTGSLIQAGTSSNTQAMPVVTLAQWNRLRLVVPVPESAVPELHLGSAIDVVVPALGRTFKGKVARFADALSDETRTMRAEIDVENLDGKLVGGMYAETALLLHQANNALSIPVQAVKRNGAQARVMVVSPSGVVEERSVQLGVESGELVEVISGLQEGDQVIVGNLSQFQSGEHVQPKLIAPHAPSTSPSESQNRMPRVTETEGGA